jgi:hypothetical protein
MLLWFYPIMAKRAETFCRIIWCSVQNAVFVLIIKIRYRSSRRWNNTILKQKAGHGLGWSCSGQGAVAGSSEHGNESSDSIKCGDILDCLTNQSAQFRHHYPGTFNTWNVRSGKVYVNFENVLLRNARTQEMKQPLPKLSTTKAEIMAIT